MLRRYAHRLELALHACPLACAHAHVAYGMATRLTTISRRARPYVTGCASLVDDKRRRLKLDEKGTVGPAIATALAIRGVHRPRAAQTDRSSIGRLGRPQQPQRGSRATTSARRSAVELAAAHVGEFGLRGAHRAASDGRGMIVRSSPARRAHGLHACVSRDGTCVISLGACGAGVLRHWLHE